MRSYFPQIRDEELVLAAQHGNLEAFDEIVRRFRGAMIVVAAQVLGSRDAAEDVAQDALMLAFKALPQLQDRSKFAGWLYAITRHRAKRVRTQAGRSTPTEPSDLDRILLAHSRELAVCPEEECLRRRERAEVYDTLVRLPAEYRTVLQLFYYEQWPVARIADFLGLSITTVKWRLHHGRTLVRRHLTELAEDHHDEREEGVPERDTARPPAAA